MNEQTVYIPRLLRYAIRYSTGQAQGRGEEVEKLASRVISLCERAVAVTQSTNVSERCSFLGTFPTSISDSMFTSPNKAVRTTQTARVQLLG